MIDASREDDTRRGKSRESLSLAATPIVGSPDGFSMKLTPPASRERELSREVDTLAHNFSQTVP